MRYRIHSGASVNVCEIDERGRLQVGGLHDEHADPSSDAQRRGCSGWPQASHHRMGKFSNDRRMRRSCIKPLAPLVRRNQDHATSRIIRSLMTALLASALPLPSLAAWGIESSPKEATTLMSPIVTPWGVLQAPQDRAKASPTFSDRSCWWRNAASKARSALR
jgi:hypothetical protein